MTQPHARPRPRRRKLRIALTTLALLGAYPALVLVATYVAFFHARLPGGRNGPADAYRHSLASAIVAYTLTPRCVELVTHVMERDGVGSDARAMDAHNNRLGARIGAAAESWSGMQTAVLDAVRQGAANVDDPDRITWLPPERWQNRLY